MQLKRIVPLVIALALTGCSSSPKEPPAKAGRRTASARTNDVAMPGGKPVVRPVETVSGRVVSVNDQLRFVIVDFPNQKMPRLEQKLSVYRTDQKVAEIKVSGPYR